MRGLFGLISLCVLAAIGAAGWFYRPALWGLAVALPLVSVSMKYWEISGRISSNR